jgi:phosphoribosyl-AMP cyclohydrolase
VVKNEAMPAPASGLPAAIADRLKRTADGLVPAVVQDAGTGRVLMMAWMNDESLAMTLTTRQATYWSRSRNELWRKGATSGHTQYVRQVELDCDGDTLLLQVDQVDGACHTGKHSCFDAGGILLGAPDDGGKQ